MRGKMINFASSLGLVTSGLDNEPGDLVGVRDQREMAGLQLDGLGFHSFGQKTLEARIHGAIFR